MATISPKPKNTIKASVIKEQEPSVKKADNSQRKENLLRISGLFLILASVFMLLSFISYFFFSWKTDMSAIMRHNTFGSLLREAMPEATENWMKLAGAYLGHLFIYRWFGISSFIFVFIFFITGFRLFFKRELFPIIKTTATSLFLIFWISITFGLLFHNLNGLLGGMFGLNAQNWLRGALGYTGTVLILLFTMISYLILMHSVPINEWILMLFKRKKNDAAEIVPENDIADINPKEDNTEEIDEEEDDDEPVTFVVKTNEEELAPPPIFPSDIKEISLEIEKPAISNGDNLPTADQEKGTDENDGSLPGYEFPSVDLLINLEEKEVQISQSELEERKNLIIQTLRNYNIEIDKIKATVGPTVTLYEIVPAAGVRISKIRNLEDDIALSLAALGIRIIAPIPGRGTIGIEVPNKSPEIVSIRSVISSAKFQNFDKELPIVLGKTISNEVYMADLAKMPHLLIAGATGQGKSVGINIIITSLLYKKHPSQVKFVMIDPKKVELSIYQKIEKHFLAKLPGTDSSIITDVSEVVQALNALVAEMEQRMVLFNKIPVRHITDYNSKFNAGLLQTEDGHRFLPYIVLIVDELADLMLTAGKEVEMPIARLAQVARAFGIHLIVSTQRPSVNIITGTIKANFPARLAFRVIATVDSRTILDHKGAEQLIGNGDMLLSMGSDMIRLQCPLIETIEVENIINHISAQPAPNEIMLLPEVKSEKFEALDNIDDIDPMFADAARIIVQHQQGSTSLIQRRMKLGYNRAGRIMDQLEAAGVVGPSEGSKARSVLIQDDYALEQFLTGYLTKKSTS